MAGGSVSLSYVVWPLAASLVALVLYYARALVVEGVVRLGLWWAGTALLVLSGWLLWSKEGDKGFLHTLIAEFKGESAFGKIISQAGSRVTDASLPFAAFVVLAVAVVGLLSGLAFSVEEEGRRSVRTLVLIIVSAIIGGYVALWLGALGFSA